MGNTQAYEDDRKRSKIWDYVYTVCKTEIMNIPADVSFLKNPPVHILDGFVTLIDDAIKTNFKIDVNIARSTPINGKVAGAAINPFLDYDNANNKRSSVSFMSKGLLHLRYQVYHRGYRGMVQIEVKDASPELIESCKPYVTKLVDE
jgi:hypothetical protein